MPTPATKTISRNPTQPVELRWLPALLFVSGAIALVYEVVWQRQFALLLGSAAPATAAVLAAYFAGLGLGSAMVGRFAKAVRRPLRLYAIIEAMIGMGALLVSPLLSWFEADYQRLFAAFSASPVLFTLVRCGMVFGALLIPTFCMGGTLPLLGALVDRQRHRLGLTAGWLYVVNTAGAALGALVVPFWFLPRLGMSATVGLCVAGNAVVAVLAWWFDRRVGAMIAEEREREMPTTRRKSSAISERDQRDVMRGALVLSTISGFVTFALQVLWNRAFAQVHENSMYSFAVIVAVVIFALACGAQVARIGLRRGIEPRRLLGAGWLAGGVAIVAGPAVFLKMSGGLAYLTASSGWAGHAGLLVGYAMAVVFPSMALLGIGLPAIMEDAGRAADANASRTLGRLLAWNIVGSVAGALAAGFALPHWLGLWNSVLWLGALALAAGFWQWGRGAWKWGLACAAGWMVCVWPIANIELPRVRLASADGERLLSLAEGTHGITAVVERAGSRRLKLNNHYALGGTASTGDERMQAHLPLLLHPAPKNVAFLGLGTGISAGGTLFHPVQRVTAMELVPEVVEAARTSFAEANAGVASNVRVRVVVDDARNYLRGSGERFDVIVGDLVVPWRQGEGSLFTLEQFRAARNALAPGGLYCQWLPLFQLSEEETTILARTFLTVFPRALVWRGDFSPTQPAIALIGTANDFAVEPEVVNRRLTELRADPANPHLGTAAAVWMYFVGVLEAGDLPPSETRLNTEDRPWVELLGPLRHAGGRADALFTGRPLQAWLERVRQNARARMPMLTEAQETAMEAGAALGEMTLCMAENNREGALAAENRIRALVPAETFRQLFR